MSTIRSFSSNEDEDEEDEVKIKEEIDKKKEDTDEDDEDLLSVCSNNVFLSSEINFVGDNEEEEEENEEVEEEEEEEDSSIAHEAFVVLMSDSFEVISLPADMLQV